ncbi:hypothetical protein CAPTEDRAFT_2916 [Capitella teleta]|uniref:Guanine nucleotide-binding protein-like 1 n=1 Tax=Capitella teleta TaxID=283909 RepID=R7TCN2_CAPTE|nr:hypothetical protein CAPTEDRAFT_2916 [Capitella teleta]|eukprot:ELT91484.1 hypothetical protein CAPTEDRAFT_2916 [Capitella teleta]
MPRKKPFSAKQKKEQLQAKRDKKRAEEPGEYDIAPDSRVGWGVALGKPGKEAKPTQPVRSQAKGYDPNRYRLHFKQESEAEIHERKQAAMRPYKMLPETALEINMDDIYKPGSVLDMPQRPVWQFSMTKEKLLAQEEKYFRNYIDSLVEKYGADQEEQLSYFELNLETWRQLWRVLEMSEILLLITDIRHPALHFSPAFYEYVTQTLNKKLILVLNKIDLAPPAIVVAWKHYFQTKFPELQIVCFTSFPKDKLELEQAVIDAGKVLFKKRKKTKKASAVGPKDLLKACDRIVNGRGESVISQQFFISCSVDLLSWKEKIEADFEREDPIPLEEVRIEEGEDSTYEKHEDFRGGVLTIGCCGYPNVGKSSLMNGLVGRKVVSVSKTPGHTKHFQTIFLTPSVRLCDSPGLVFPSLVSKPMQAGFYILAGIYPIAQVREPYTAVGYLAERIPLPKLLRIKHPEEAEANVEEGGRVPDWSPYDICDAWAEKRGFLTARAARPDVYRAANNLLRLALEGRLCMCTRPPNYTAHKDEWERHQETEEIAAVQEMHRRATMFSDAESDDELSQEEEKDKDDGEDEEEEEEEEGAMASNPFSLLQE